MLLLLFLLTDFGSPPKIRNGKGLKDFGLQRSQLFGGDMILPRRLLRNGITDEDYRWPGYPGRASVPYVIDESLEHAKDLILEAMDVYHRNTCVRFVPRTNETEYLKIFQGIDGCYSIIGRDRHIAQPQPVSLTSGCLDLGTIIHELGHTLGFFHEQNRSDRDDYLIVYKDNVLEGSLKNFLKLSSKQNLLLSPFDYNSIMIYGNYAFSKDGVSKTMEAKNGQRLLNPYEKSSMTVSDIRRVRMLYKCDD